MPADVLDEIKTLIRGDGSISAGWIGGHNDMGIPISTADNGEGREPTPTQARE